MGTIPSQRGRVMSPAFFEDYRVLHHKRRTGYEQGLVALRTHLREAWAHPQPAHLDFTHDGCWRRRVVLATLLGLGHCSHAAVGIYRHA